MIPLAFSFIAGTIAFHYCQYFPVTISVSCVSFIIFAFFTFRANRKNILLICLTFIFAFVYSFARQPLLPEISVPDYEVMIEGNIVGVPEMAGSNLLFAIEAVDLEKVDIQGKIRLVLSGEMLNSTTMNHILPGRRIAAVAKLKKPDTYFNPGVHSYDSRRDGIVAYGYVKGMKGLADHSGMLNWVHRKRKQIGIIINRSLAGDKAALLNAIIPGLKKGLSQELRDSFSTTGLAHLLSISGTHFGLLAFIIFSIIKNIVKHLPGRILKRITLYITPTQLGAMLTFPALIFYLLISGMSIPSVRSFIMVAIFMLALIFGRRGQWLNSLAIAACIILLWRPDTLFDLSFALSFLAVYFIGHFLESDIFQRTQGRGHIKQNHKKRDFRQLVHSMKEKIKTGVIISVSAVFGTAPVIAVAFNQFPLISPLTNLIVTPLICLVLLPLGLVSSLCALILGFPVIPFNTLTDWMTGVALGLVKLFSAVPYANFHIHDPSFILVLLYYIAAFIIIKSRSVWRFVPLVAVLSIYLVLPYCSSGHMRAVFLDVGQGDASVVELPDKKIMLIDGGTKRPDMGRRIIAPYLWSRGVKKIDFIVLSHPHPDHYGGLIYIMENFKVGQVWLTGRTAYESGDFFNVVNKKKIPYKILARGDVLASGKYRIYVLHPYGGFHAGSPRGAYSNQNSDSMVLRVEADGSSILFTGDIEQEAEEDLVFLGDSLQSDVLKVPHHGSRTSIFGSFIEAVKPGLAVISVGRNNYFHHPHISALDTYQDSGIRVLRTDLDGAVEVYFINGSYKTRTYSDYTLKKVEKIKDEARNLRLLFNSL
jgi:competence protein ComEC